MVVIKRPKVAALSRALGQSNRCVARGGFGRLHTAKASAPRPIGTLIANSQGQLATDRMAAATLGPIADAIATTRALRPMPRPSRRRG